MSENTPRHRAAQRESPDPSVDADSEERLAEEVLDPPHGPSRFEAPNGQGTSDGPPYEQELQERPVLDGATQSPEAEASVPNPYRGVADPARITRQPALHSTKPDRWLIAGVIAGTILVVFLLVIASWDPFWCGLGVIFALVMLLAMLGTRASRLERGAKLRVEAVLMAFLCIVPLAIGISVLVSHAREIWPSIS